MAPTTADDDDWFSRLHNNEQHLLTYRQTLQQLKYELHIRQRAASDAPSATLVSMQEAIHRQNVHVKRLAVICATESTRAGVEKPEALRGRKLDEERRPLTREWLDRKLRSLRRVIVSDLTTPDDPMTTLSSPLKIRAFSPKPTIDDEPPDPAPPPSIVVRSKVDAQLAGAQSDDYDELPEVEDEAADHSDDTIPDAPSASRVDAIASGNWRTWSKGKKPKTKQLPLKFECDECGRRFALKNSFDLHLRRHSARRPYQCPDCDRRYITLRDVQRHRLTHLNVRPFQCPTCLKFFSRSEHLANHRRTVHEGEKRFLCNECGNRYPTGASLKRHMRIHTGEKPYECDCGKKFSDSSGLRHHQLRWCPGS